VFFVKNFVPHILCPVCETIAVQHII